MSARWTDETERLLLARVSAQYRTDNWSLIGMVREGLTALADAGLLLIDSEDRRQHGVRLGGDGPIIATAHPDWTHYRLVGEWREVTEEAKP